MTIFERAANFLTGGALVQLSAEVREVASEANAALQGEHVAREKLVELEASLRAEGWQIATGTGSGGDNKEFSRKALKDIGRLARLMWLKNPLIRRGVNVQAHYVFGQGVTVSFDDDLVNETFQSFWDDLKNKKVLTERQALQQREREQTLFGNTFFAFFTNRLYGSVTVRVFDCDSIEKIITNPNDREEPWFYERHWVEVELDYESGETTETKRISYHPDWLHNPAKKPKTLGGHPIEWDVPVYHVATGNLSDNLFGLSEVYPQIDWAKAYTKFLENRATVAAALSRFVLKASTKTKAGVNAIKSKLASTVGLGKGETNPAPAAGATAILGEGRDLEAMSIKGATINPEEGRRFLLMVACGAGFPETFYGDVSVGTLATAESLDRPTEMAMEDRRGLWSTVLSNIALYVLLQAVRAPKNALFGKATVKYVGTTPVLYIGANKIDINVDFPQLLQPNQKDLVESIDKAAKYLQSKPRLLAKMMLLALRQKNVDELVEDIPETVDPAELAAAAAQLPKTADTEQGKTAQDKKQQPKAA